MLRQNPNSEGDHDFHLQKRRGWNAKQKQKQNSNLVNENGQEADRQENPQSQKTVVFNEKWSIQRKRNKAERKIGTDNEIGDFEPSKQVNQNKKNMAISFKGKKYGDRGNRSKTYYKKDFSKEGGRRGKTLQSKI